MPLKPGESARSLNDEEYRLARELVTREQRKPFDVGQLPNAKELSPGEYKTVKRRLSQM